MSSVIWNKVCLSTQFESESCCFGDVDGDGLHELVAGDSWWRLDAGGERYRFRSIPMTWLPEWPHDRALDPLPHLRRASGEAAQYRASTYDWAARLSGAPGTDIVSIGMHRDPVVWHENPGHGRGRWNTHRITDGGIYESAVFSALGPDVPHALVTVPTKGAIAWFEPRSDPRDPWQMHTVATEGGEWHGLGLGDLDNDGKSEIVCKDYLFKRRGDAREPWARFPIWQILEDGKTSRGLGDVFIVRIAKLKDVRMPVLVSASPHARGVWLWTLEETTPTRWLYRRTTLESATTQVHALHVVDPSRDGRMVVLFGKRWQAHGATGDIEPAQEPALVELREGLDGWRNPRRTEIDVGSGIGVHFDVVVTEGLMEVGTSNKRGVFVFREKRSER